VDGLSDVSDTVIEGLATFDQDRLVAVTCLFPVSTFGAVEEVLFERYGRPTSALPSKASKWTGKQISLTLNRQIADDCLGIVQQAAELRREVFMQYAYETAKARRDTAFKIAMINPTASASDEYKREAENATAELNQSTRDAVSETERFKAAKYGCFLLIINDYATVSGERNAELRKKAAKSM
jgi:hypothetical protein